MADALERCVAAIMRWSALADDEIARRLVELAARDDCPSRAARVVEAALWPYAEYAYCTYSASGQVVVYDGMFATEVAGRVDARELARALLHELEQLRQRAEQAET